MAARGAGAVSLRRMRRIGVLTILTGHDPEGRARDSVRAGAEGFGLDESAQPAIESLDGRPRSIRRYAAELVALAPDVIVTAGSAALIPVLQATRTIPIVLTIVPDPVGAGFIKSLARPGGNATGFIQFEYSLTAKWLELLKEIAPGITRVAVLREPGLDRGDWPVRRHSGSRTVACGSNSCRSTFAMPSRNRTDGCRICALGNDGLIVTGGRIGGCSSRADHRNSGPPQTAHGLPLALLRRSMAA